MIERFSLDWLRLREPHDLRSRSRELGRRFGAAVRARAGEESASFVDLAAGTGANFRALAPLIPGEQDWRLVDHDRALVGHQSNEIAQWARAQGWRVAHGSGVVTVVTSNAQWRAHSLEIDLAHDLDELPLRVHGIACAALLDLVSASWLEQLVDRIATARAPFLAALSVDGRRHWMPPHPDDAAVARAFAGHQRGDKGFGPALGCEASGVAEDLFVARGYRVTAAAGEWRLSGGDDDMLAALIEGAVATGTDVEPCLDLARWRDDRHETLRRGELSLGVGHVDILAEPDESPPAQP